MNADAHGSDDAVSRAEPQRAQRKPGRECPKCGSEMELIDDEPDAGIGGGWNGQCGHTELYEYEREPLG